MAATLYTLITEGITIYYNGGLSEGFKQKISVIAGRFSTVAGFKSAAIDSINQFKTTEGDLCFRRLTPKETAAVTALQNDLEPDKTVIQNFIKILTQEFVRKQIAKIDGMSIDNLNANPILCTALNLKTPEEFIRYAVYQSVGRSIVTSMGFFVQNLLLYLSDDVYDGKDYKEGTQTKFDIVIDRLNEVRTFLEIKSGFNDMDAAQIKHYRNEIEKVESLDFKGGIGITYGRKGDTTVTAGLLRTYFKDWEQRTYVGKELWDYVSRHENYHLTLLENIDSIAASTLHNISIVARIETKIDELIKVFYTKYNSLKEYYNSLF